MNTEVLIGLIQTIISVLGFVAVVVSLIYVAQNIKTQVYQSIGNQLIDINKVFVDHPELRPYFYEGKEISKGSKLYGLATSIAEMRLDFYDSVLIQMKYFPKYFVVGWKETIRDVFAFSPIMRETLEIRRKWYSPGLVQLARQVVN